ncbi:Thioredoxin-like protein 1 [Armadillidium nasatum]|uniref:Thioredoxin-like protein 1 n=1 Tax=Armadillidium nasatum TaxID=96803 RepID=A0A5N5SZ49_9CRUS|nr:Thioredoxin-like protein 1 [Armadillidium nasatum]
MSSKYKNANFLKVDIQNCPNSAQLNGVQATPTFIFFRNKTKIDSIRGANMEALEAKIKQHYGDGESEDSEDCGVPGHLIIYIAFNQSVKIHSLRIKAPGDSGPKNIKLFINQPYTLDFDAAETGIPVQELELSKKDLDGDLINLKYVRFQNIMNLAIFIQDNQSGSEITKVSNIQLIGSPVQTTNMSDFKRIAGKKGESH